MILRPSRKPVLAFFSLVIALWACQPDEISPLENAIFKIHVSDEFIVNYHQYVLIISDYEGEVLLAQKLNTRGVHELEVTGRADGVYHLTLFDGNRSFQTFASVAPDEFPIDVLKIESSTAVGTHSFLLENPTITSPIVSGENLLYSNGVADEKINLHLTETSSDIYFFYERNNEPYFLYYPSLTVNGSTTITASDFANGHTFSKRSVTRTPNLGGPNILLNASVESNSRRMEYFLSKNNGGAHILVPDGLMPKLKFFATTFAAIGNTYSLVGPEIATQQKVLSVTGGITKTTPSSIFYSIDTSGSMIKCSASSPTLNWSIVSPPGRNVKVNLPKLSQEFQNGYTFGDLQALKFVTAGVFKDTRFGTYQNFVKASIKNDNNPVFASEYELYYQEISLPN